ncbi:hypothetical protein GOP47_0022060 [Adiantum capillus-veneris]|uniref:Uncharacterized protein n=1 Tax=Adiantum capillus-veneris TaxID=13818 RepID=A0A9D4U9K2_ADICA|nr:hypothetical protein GOP47_0022060 [Adiantum capillus-veneris]
MRRKEVSLLPVVDDTELLDIREQEKIVRELEARHARHSFTWRVIFATLTSIFSAFFLVSAYLQLISPWDLKYHAYFMDEMSPLSVVIADLVDGTTAGSCPLNGEPLVVKVLELQFSFEKKLVMRG